MQSINPETSLTTLVGASSDALSILRPNQSIDIDILNKTFDTNNSDNVDVNFGDLYKSLTITSKQIVDKINEILKDKLPDGVQSLKPSDVTPESTSDNIVKGVASIFSAFAKQNSDLSPEDLIKKFIEQAKSGVEQGYGQAKQILGDLGAFNYEGVESGISSTKDLILQKLDTFATQKLAELTGKSVTAPAAAISEDDIIQQGGSNSVSLQA